MPGLDGVAQRAAELLERIAAPYTSGEGRAVAAAAREEFLSRTGRVHEDDPAFDNRMTIFLEWFVIDYPLPSEGDRTAGERFAERRAPGLDPTARRLLLAVLSSHRSLFEVVDRVAPGQLVLADLLFGLRWKALAPPGAADLAAGEVLDARLLGVGGEVHFSSGICYHPRDVAPGIRRYVARLRRSGRVDGGVLDELMKLRLAYDRAGGVPTSDIYRL